MFQNEKVTAILLAGGSGTRFGAAGNKVYVNACGKPILQYSLEVLTRNPYVDECVLVVRDGDQDEAEKILDRAAERAQAPDAGTGEKENFRVPVRMVTGGSTRQESVLKGLNAASGGIVLIHDGARPLIRDSCVSRCIETMSGFAGCTAAVRAKDTIKMSDGHGIVTKTTDRAHTWIVQTPQCFRKDVLLAAHRKFRDAPGITDDCRLLELAGEPVKLVESDYTNIKVTTPEDLRLVEIYLRAAGRESG